MEYDKQDHPAKEREQKRRLYRTIALLISVLVIFVVVLFIFAAGWGLS